MLSLWRCGPYRNFGRRQPPAPLEISEIGSARSRWSASLWNTDVATKTSSKEMREAWYYFSDCCRGQCQGSCQPTHSHPSVEAVLFDSIHSAHSLKSSEHTQKKTPACSKSFFPHLQWLWILPWSLQCALARGRSSTSSWQPGVTAIISHQMPTSVLWTCTYLQGKSVYLASFLSPCPYCQNRGIWSFPRMGPIVCSLIHTQFSPWAWMWNMKENYWKTKDN